jgi:hypothetical protein
VCTYCTNAPDLPMTQPVQFMTREITTWAVSGPSQVGHLGDMSRTSESVTAAHGPCLTLPALVRKSEADESACKPESRFGVAYQLATLASFAIDSESCSSLMSGIMLLN